MINFFKDAKYILFAQVILRAKGFFVLPVLTHYLGATDYGVWTQVSGAASLFIPLILWSMGAGFVQLGSHLDREQQMSIMYSWLFVIFLLSVILTPVIYFFREYISDLVLGTGNPWSSLVLFISVFCFSSALTQACTAWLKISGQSGLFSIYIVVLGFVSIVSSLYLLVMRGDIFDLVIITISMELLLTLSFISIQFFKYKPRVIKFQYAKLWEIFKFSLPLVPIAYASVGVNWSDRLVLLQYVDITQIGIYNMYHGLAMMLVQTITQPFRSFYPSRATRLLKTGEIDELRKLYELSAGTLFALYCPAIIGLIIVAPILVSFLAPPEFGLMPVLLPLIFAGYAVSRLTSYLHQELIWKKKQAAVSVSIYLCLFLNLVLNFILVPIFGVIGAAVASLSSFILQYFGVFIYLGKNRVTRNSMTFIFKTGCSAIVMGIGLISVGPEGIDVLSGLDRYVVFPIFVVLGAAIYFSILLLCGGLKITHLRVILHSLRGRDYNERGVGKND